MSGLKCLAIGITGAALLLGATAGANAGTLENLERERAQMVKLMFNADVGHVERQSKIEGMRRRLVDLERMVLRDDSLKGQSTQIVQRAFANYDLTFLAHAAIEKERTITDNWLEQVGLTTDALMTARYGDNAPIQLGQQP